ncbi:MAG: DPP IV N-terminal domain-containing protein [Melioribacteraceae bacterium]|nr:DPP IV N-terminal domain-containing protein [Melioribacteraceae bacterium]
MKRYFLILLFLTVSLSAQVSKFSASDIVMNSRTTLKAKTLEKLKWLPGEASYSFVEEEEGKQILMKGSRSGKKSRLVALEDLNAELREYDQNAKNKFPSYNWISDNEFLFWNNNTLFSYNLDSKELEKINQIESEAGTKRTSPDFNKTAYIYNNNLYISFRTDSVKQITFDGEPDFTYGVSVSRNEFGISSGMFWSPKSSYLAFYHEDLRNVTDYPLLNVNTVPASAEFIKYPMAGMTSTKVRIGVYDLVSDKITWLDTKGFEEQYLTSVSWSPDERNLYVAHLNRDQNHLQLYKYNPDNGEQVSLLFEERNDKYVEPEDTLCFVPDHPEKFIWCSERDGYKHAYLYDCSGNELGKLTSGDWEITQIHGFDAEAKHLFITSTEESPVERHFYKINLNDFKRTKLTIDKGWHNISIHNSGFYYIDEYSSVEVPHQTRLINYKGEIESIILNSENPLKDRNAGKVRLLTLENDSGTELYGRIVFPPDFDSTKIYPAIVYVYGGPHAQLVQNRWLEGKYGLWFYRMAQEGYIVFTLDNRGSAFRGLEFEQATFRNLGSKEIEDQMTGIKYLKSLQYIDSTRFGVFGWSYGGFMTTSLMLRTNNTFKTGVAGGAVINWELYEVMYTERYMDTPEANPEGYKESNLLNYVDNLNGKLLLVHGTDDPTVVWQHTLLFAEKAMDLNKSLDYFPYVGHRHGVVGSDGIHLYQKIIDYFTENL